MSGIGGAHQVGLSLVGVVRAVIIVVAACNFNYSVNVWSVILFLGERWSIKTVSCAFVTAVIRLRDQEVARPDGMIDSNCR